MKYINKIFFLFGFFSTLCLSMGCNNEDMVDMKITAKERSLNLIAPSGERIADNIASLKNETALVVGEIYGVDKVFEITELNYLQTKEGYIVIIEYKTEDGLSGAYALSKNTIVNYSCESVVLKSFPKRLRSATEGEGGGGSSTTYVCKAIDLCTSCKLKGSYNPNTGENTITCSCNQEVNGCEMEITYRQ